MTVLVHLRESALMGPVEVDEDFREAINALNMTTAKGNAFTVMDAPDGSHEAFYIPNITRIKEVL